jgi:hypothetical protein
VKVLWHSVRFLFRTPDHGGCNVITTVHNPPAPEFPDPTGRMYFLVVNEIFDARSNTWSDKSEILLFDRKIASAINFEVIRAVLAPDINDIISGAIRCKK